MKKLLLIAAVALSGCAVSIEPTEENQRAINVLVKLPPAQAYQNLVRAAKEKCFPMVIDAQFYTNTNAGDISLVSQFDGQIRLVWLNVAIKPTGDDSAVTLQHRGKVSEFVEPSIKWMNGQDAKCPINMR